MRGWRFWLLVIAKRFAHYGQLLLLYLNGTSVHLAFSEIYSC